MDIVWIQLQFPLCPTSHLNSNRLENRRRKNPFKYSNFFSFQLERLKILRRIYLNNPFKALWMQFRLTCAAETTKKIIAFQKHFWKDQFLLCFEQMKQLNAEPIEGTSLAFEGTDNIHYCHRLPLGTRRLTVYLMTFSQKNLSTPEVFS